MKTKQANDRAPEQYPQWLRDAASRGGASAGGRKARASRRNGKKGGRPKGRDGIVCPWCNHKADDSDAWGIPNMPHASNGQCPICERHFQWSRRITKSGFKYNAERKKVVGGGGRSATKRSGAGSQNNELCGGGPEGGSNAR